MDPQKNIYDMKDIIVRCFKECEEAGHIKRTMYDHGEPGWDLFSDSAILVNQDAVADHISKTLIGELTEFEIIRRLSPIFREVQRLSRDFHILDDRQAAESNLAALRIGKG